METINLYMTFHIKLFLIDVFIYFVVEYDMIQ